MNRLGFELRKRTTAARCRRLVWSLHDPSSDWHRELHRVNRMSWPEEMNGFQGTPGDTSDIPWMAEHRAKTRPPRAGLAGTSNDFGDYESALYDMEGIDEFVARCRTRVGDSSDYERQTLMIECMFHRERAKALAGLGRTADAEEELDRAEACARAPGSGSRTGPGAGHLAALRREDIAEVWEMLDEPQREAAILDPLPDPQDAELMIEAAVRHAREAAAAGLDVEPQRLQPPQPSKGRLPDTHTARFWAATLEASIRSGHPFSDKHRQIAQGALAAVAVQWVAPGLPVHERCRAIACEALDEPRRALHGWQRYCLALWAGAEPDNSPLWERAWRHVERLGGKRWM